MNFIMLIIFYRYLKELFFKTFHTVFELKIKDVIMFEEVLRQTVSTLLSTKVLLYDLCVLDICKCKSQFLLPQAVSSMR